MAEYIMSSMYYCFSCQIRNPNSFYCCHTFLYIGFHITFDERVPKFTTNLAISLRSCQSNHELRNEVVNFTNFVASEVRILQCSWFGNITTNKSKQSENVSRPSKAYFMMFTSEM